MFMVRNPFELYFMTSFANYTNEELFVTVCDKKLE